MSFGYALRLVEAARIDVLKGHFETSLRALVDHCLARSAVELTPSDLTFKGLSLDELDSLFDDD